MISIDNVVFQSYMEQLKATLKSPHLVGIREAFDCRRYIVHANVRVNY